MTQFAKNRIKILESHRNLKSNSLIKSIIRELRLLMHKTYLLRDPIAWQWSMNECKIYLLMLNYHILEADHILEDENDLLSSKRCFVACCPRSWPSLCNKNGFLRRCNLVDKVVIQPLLLHSAHNPEKRIYITEPKINGNFKSYFDFLTASKESLC